MKVTFFVSNYPPSVGGAQSHVQRVAEGLANDHGHVVRVLTTDAQRTPAARYPGRVDAPRRELLNGVMVERLPLSRRIHGVIRFARRVRVKTGITEPATYTRLDVGPHGLRLTKAAFLAARTSDLVVGVGAPYLTLSAAELMTRHSNIACIEMPLLHLAVEEPYRFVVSVLERADGVTSSTSHERDWLVAHGVEFSRTAILPPGCDPSIYSDTAPSAARRSLGLPERLTVGYVGRLAANKGLDVFARSAEEIWRTHPETSILVVGRRSGWLEIDPIITRLREVGGERFIFREGFDESERSDIFAACDVIVFPSVQESFGMITVEAWCARRPVVACDIGAVRSLIRPGSDGELVPVGDHLALAYEVLRLLDDPERRMLYGETGRYRAETEFAWDHLISGWDDFIHEVVRRKRFIRAGGRTR